MATFELQLLRVPQLRHCGQPLTLRTRKVLALLVYLTLEPRAHTRDELAELLWSTQHSTARASLRFALCHLHAALGVDLPLIVTPGSVELPRTDQLWVDALQLEAQAGDRATPPSPEAAALWKGDFMTGFTLPDAPSWDEWATSQVQHYRDRHDAVLARLTDAQVRAGQAWDAIRTAQRRVTHDLLNEDAYRQLSHAQRAAGLNAEAEVTLRTCTDVLRRELGLAPPLHLGTETRTGPHIEPRPLVVKKRGPVVSPARPLVGREVELQRMEDAWEKGQVVFLAGGAGAGKTALVAAFLALHPSTAFFQVDAQPINSTIPYSVQARLVRTVLETLDVSALPARIAHDLAPMVPELASTPSQPFTSPEEKLRLFDAYTDFLGLMGLAALPKRLTMVSENLHWWDRESHAMGAYAAMNGLPKGVFAQAIVTYRPELIPGDFIKTVLPVVEAGLAVVINVPPLNADQVHELLAQVEPRISVEVAQRLHDYTAGNPLFVTETARLLQARGGLFQADLNELPRSKRIRDTITERLSRLSPEVQAVARVAAVAAADFSFRLAARVLRADDLQLASAFETLEAAGLFRNESFAHDLLRDAAYDVTPLTARMVLHGRVLDALQGKAVAPAVLAWHAQQARRWEEARAWLMRASQSARDMLADQEADDFEQQALALLAR